jgi:L-asparaginase
MAKPRICVLFAGGTIGMVKDPSSGIYQPAANSHDLIREMPEIQKIMTLDFKFVMNIDSSNIGALEWQTIAEAVKKNYDNYDGFVIAHGTDTMVYTASALSLALRNLSKPVVLTGALIPLSELGSDGRNNLIYSCLTATLDIAEVCIVFSSKIIRGNRAKKHHESFTDVFHSPNYPYLGELGNPSMLYEWRKKRRRRVLEFQPKFDPRISLLKIYPGFDPDIIDRAVERGARGIIIEAFGPGNVPFLSNSIIPQIEKAVSASCPVVIATQMERGVTNLNRYEGGYLAHKAGAISSHDMTTEATVCKLMWALAQTNSISKIRKIFETDIAGEVTLNA